MDKIFLKHQVSSMAAKFWSTIFCNISTCICKTYYNFESTPKKTNVLQKIIRYNATQKSQKQEGGDFKPDWLHVNTAKHLILKRYLWHVYKSGDIKLYIDGLSILNYLLSLIYLIIFLVDIL